MIKLGPNGTPEWIYTFDGAGLDDAFVDAVPIFHYANPGWFYLLAEFTNEDGMLRSRLYKTTPDGQILATWEFPAEADAHLRPVGLGYADVDDNLTIAAEHNRNGISRAKVFLMSPHLSSYYETLHEQHPWGVARSLRPDTPIGAYVLGTHATPMSWVDTRILVAQSWQTFNYSAPVRGFDAPAGAAGHPTEGVVVAIHSFGGYTGDDVVLMRIGYMGTIPWGYRYTNDHHNDYLVSMAFHPTQSRLYALVDTQLWAGELFERWQLGLLQFDGAGQLERATLIDTGRPISDRTPIIGELAINSIGQPVIAVAPPPVLARLSRTGQPLWTRPLSLTPHALVLGTQGEICVAGTSIPHYARPETILVVKYAPSGDVNGDGIVNDSDLLAVLFAFGTHGDSPADLNSDGVVDDADLLLVLFDFGRSG